MIAGSSWFVSGASGTFGHAFIPRLLEGGARRVVCFSRDELKQAHMRDEFKDDRLRFFLGDVRDAIRVRLALEGVDYVVHAAAMKRIEKCEDDPWEACQTNIGGTHNVAMAAIEAGVSKAVLLSTDKAAAPCTHYGATKLAAERLWVRSNVYAGGKATRLSATRYGNVLGSRGSVLGIWKHQAEHAGELTLTDGRATRYWMQPAEAVELVFRAFREMRGGEVFIPRIPSCDLPTLARTVAPGIPYIETGLRRNEKLHETLISEDEAMYAVDHGTHWTLEPERTWEGAVCDPVTPRQPYGWSYRSDTNPNRLETAAELVA